MDAARLGEAVAHHRPWYDRFDKHDHCRTWESLLASQPEAAICEAMTREELQRYAGVVFPNENLSFGGPDSRCIQKTPTGQQHFYVDSTCTNTTHTYSTYIAGWRLRRRGMLAGPASGSE